MILNNSDLEYYFKVHIENQRAIWEELRQKLYQRYIDEGYWEGFAEVKATNDVLELRSGPKNPSTITIPKEQTTQGDLD